MILTIPNPQIIKNTNINQTKIVDTSNIKNQLVGADEIKSNEISLIGQKGTYKSSTPGKQLTRSRFLLPRSDIYVQYNFLTDQFTIDFYMGWTYYYGAKSGSFYIDTYTNLNNDSQLNYNKSIWTDGKNYVRLTIKSTDFSKKIKYSELKTLNFSCWFDGEEYKYNYFFPELKQKSTNVTNLILDSSYDEYIVKVQNGFSRGANNELEPIFAEIKLKPKELKFGLNNTDLLEIETESEDLRKVRFEPIRVLGLPSKINNQEQNKNSIENGLSVLFDETNNLAKINQPTFYDYAKKETTTEPNEKSLPGYVIPYNYDKDFNPTLEFKLNEFENLKLTWTQKIKKPYFSDNSGKIKLKISDENEEVKVPENNWNIIDSNFFEQVENKDLTYFELLEKLRKNKD